MCRKELSEKAFQFYSQQNDKKNTFKHFMFLCTIMSVPIYQEYINLTKKHKITHGEQSVVLLQVGSFFEIYGFRDSSGKVSDDVDIESICTICNLNISEKKGQHNNRQVLMAGFRDYTLEKFLEKLTQAQYTACVYVQEKEGTNIIRVFDAAYSPGTYLSFESNQQSLTNYIACIWMEMFCPTSRKSLSKMRETLVCGVSMVNILTGTSYLFEYCTPYALRPSAFDELERMIITHSPSEIIFISPFVQDDIDKISQYSGFGGRKVHYISSGENEKVHRCSQQKYSTQIIESFYGTESGDVCQEFNMYPTATQSFCFLLGYVQEQNANVIRNVKIPTFHVHDGTMLANHTLRQLNIVDDNTNDGTRCGQLSSLASFLNKCCTVMGKRRFFQQLVHPTTNKKWLEKEYELTDVLLTNEEYVQESRSFLDKIKDIERLSRQIVSRKIYPSSIYQLYQSLSETQALWKYLSNNETIQDYIEDNEKYKLSEACQAVMSYMDQEVVLENCRTQNSMTQFEDNIIQRNVNQSLDESVDLLVKSEETLHLIHKTLDAAVKEQDGKPNSQTEYIHIHETEKMGKSLQMTKKRAALLKVYIEKRGAKQLFGVKDTLWSDVQLSASSTGSEQKVVFPVLDETLRNLFYLKDKINGLVATSYLSFLATLETSFYGHLECIADYVAKIDVIINKAYIASKYHYCRPSIDSSAEKSYVNVLGLRHPLIEQLQKNELYVSNDMMIGKDSCDGILLYGTNAVGKTSFIRSLGMSVIMAQSGLYVPCHQFEFSPYSSIFSRILGNDNLFRGLSTFVVEMSELRVILKLADENSLILGDELCSGTETESALSIFTSGLIDLHEKKSSFIFASHFHEIADFQEVKELHHLHCKHMAVRYDRETDALVYDRKIIDGPGNKKYGLEVCKSLHLPDAFIERANQILNKYFPLEQGDLSHSTGNKYNAKKIRGNCELCKSALGDEIHHLHPQKLADTKGFIEKQDGSVIHKNHLANLINICNTCHDNLHRNDDNGKRVLVKKKTTKSYKIEML